MTSFALAAPRLAISRSPAEQDDATLIARAREGDHQAFERLVATYTPRVYSLVRQLLRNAAEAEDVTQEVFFKVYAKLDSFREDSAFYTWLYRVAVNAATDHLKKRRNDRTVLVEDVAALPVVDETETPAETSARQDLRSAVREAMARLPEKFRTILVLRELEGLAYEEIAEVLRISLGTVESRIFRAREKLKKLLAPDLGAS